MYRDYGTEFWRIALVAVVAGAISTILSQVPQISFGLVIEVIDPTSQGSQFPFADFLLSENSITRIIQVSVAFLLSVILIVILRFVSRYYWSLFAQSFKDSVRVGVYESIQGLHPKRFIQRSSGEYVSVVESDVNEVGNLPRTLISGVVSDFVSILTIGTVLLTLNWQLALLTLIPIPILAFYTSRFNRMIEEVYKDTREASADLTDQLGSSIRGILTVRSYAAEEHETEKVRESSNKVKKTRVEASKKFSLYSQVFSMITRSTSLLVLAVGSYWVVAGPPLFFTVELTAGELAVFFSNSTILIQPATSIQRYIDIYKDTKAVLRPRIFCN